MKEKHEPVLQQSGVLPCKNEDGKRYFLLITTSSRKEWIIPKGNIDEGLTPPESALKEAAEEAGLKGVITGESIGSYRFQKKKTGRLCRVDVFPMKVTGEMKYWKEKDRRGRRWYTPEEAAARVSNPGLKELIVKEGKRYGKY